MFCLSGGLSIVTVTITIHYLLYHILTKVDTIYYAFPSIFWLLNINPPQFPIQ